MRMCIVVEGVMSLDRLNTTSYVRVFRGRSGKKWNKGGSCRLSPLLFYTFFPDELYVRDYCDCTSAHDVTIACPI